MFEDRDLYRESNIAAHSGPLSEIKMPALTWHMAFLIAKSGNRNGASDSKPINENRIFRNDEGEPLNKDLNESRIALKDRLDDIIVSLIKGLRKFYKPAVGDAEAQSAIKSKYHLCDIWPKIDGTCVLFNRFVSWSNMATLGESATKNILEGEPRDRRATIFEADDRFVRIKFNYLSNHIFVVIQVHSNYFTVTVNATGEDIASECLNVCKSPDQSTVKSLTNVFWENYTKFLFSLKPKDDLKIRFRAELENIFADMRGIIVDEATARSDDSAIGEESSWASPIVAKFRSAMTFDDEFECTASYMMDRRLVYLTALGPQPPDYPPAERTPLTFFLCLQNLQSENGLAARRLLGRLLDRMHHAGTLRLAALLDLKLLRRASRQLRQIDAVMKDARAAVAEYEGNESRAEHAKSATELARKQLNAIRDKFFRDNTAGIGLTFRIDSSRYYVSQFGKTLTALKLQEVEDYQCYDSFVEWRLGQTLEFIDRIGNRHEQARKSMEDIDLSFATSQLRHTGTSVNEIQVYGEFILMSCLVPYYIIGIIGHLKDAKPGWETLLYWDLWLSLIAIAVVNLLLKKKKITSEFRYIMLLAFISCLSLAFFVRYLSYPGD